MERRGLLEETIVIATGEFGRTPKINNKAGRDHWQQVYSAVVAGGGLRGGQVIGQSDAKGEYPASRPLIPADLFATALNQIGIGTTALTANGLTPQGNLMPARMTSWMRIHYPIGIMILKGLLTRCRFSF